MEGLGHTRVNADVFFCMRCLLDRGAKDIEFKLRANAGEVCKKTAVEVGTDGIHLPNGQVVGKAKP